MTNTLKTILAVMFVVLAGAGAAAWAQSAPTSPGQDGVTWYEIIADDGAPLGHASSSSAPRPDGQDFIASQSLYLSEQGGAPTHITERVIRSLDASGATLSISATLRTGGFWSRTEARIAGGQAHIVRETPSGRWSGTINLPSAARFDNGEALLRTWDPAATPRLEFENFNIDAMQVERVVIAPSPSAASNAQGYRIALRQRYDRDQLVGITRLSIDGEGRIVEAEQPMFGAIIHVRTTDRETALRRHPPYHVVPNAMIRSPFRIPAPATHGQIRYRLAFRDGIGFAAPRTGEQNATQGSDAVILDICAECGPGMAADPDTLADALRSTPWLQSDHPRLRAIAAPIAALAISDTQKMELLLARARPYLGRIDFAGHYSALDTMSRRAGDCTEAAVLLAALGRAAGIPTRVANGLTYSRQSYHGVSNAFIPHSWTLAWVDGHWRSFDLALDSFDSTHIALTIGDGDARSIAAAAQLASLIRFDAMAEIRSSPHG